MAQYDGSIRIKTEITSKDAKVQLSALKNTIAKTANEISSLRSKMDAMKDIKYPTQEFQDLQGKIDAATKEMEKFMSKDSELADIDKKIKSLSQSASEYAAKMKSVGEQEIPTQAFKETQAQIEKTEKKLNDLQARQEKFLSLGGEKSSSVYQRMQYDVEELRDSLPYMKGELQDLIDTGKAFTLGTDTEKYKSLSAKYEKINQDLEKQKSIHSEITQKQAESLRKTIELKAQMKQLVEDGKDFTLGKDTDEYSKLSRQLANEKKSLAKMQLQSISIGGSDKLEKMKESFKKLGGIAKQSFEKINKSPKKSAGFLATLSSRFKGLALSLLIFNQISKAFNAMISGMKVGFQNFYNENNRFKSQIDSLKASMLTLKNSFAAAFAPLVQAVIPYIQKAIQWIVSLMNLIGQFIAALTGQKTYAKAVKQTTAAVKENTKAQAKQNKQLSNLDKLNNLTSQGDSGGGGAGGGAGNMFETEDVSPEIAKFAEKVKKIFSDIWDVFKKGWESKGQAVVKSAKAALNSLIKAAKSVGATFYEVFTNGTGLTWVESSLELLRSILDIIHSIADAFSTAWNSGAGFENVTALFNMFTNINTLLTSISDSFSRVFSNGTGVAIWTNILGIITGVYNIIGNLAESINEAWNTAGLGDSIWQGVLNIISTILGTIHNIIDSTAEWAAQLDFTPLLTSIDTLLKAIEPLTENIGEGLEWFWNNVLLPIATWTIQDAVPAFLNMLSAAIGAVNEVIEALKPLGTWLWESFLQPLGQWAGDTIIAAMQIITDLLTKFGNWISEHQEAVQEFVITVGSFAAAVGLVSAALGILIGIAKIARTVTTVFGAAITFLSSPIGIAIAIIGALIAVGVLLYKNWDTIKEKATEIWGAIKDFFKNTIESIKNFFSGLWSGIKETFANVGSWFKEKFSAAFSGIKNAFSSVGEFFSGVWSNIKSVFGNIAGWFKDKFSAAWEAVKKVFSTGGKIFNGIKDGILNGLKAVINAIIRGINKVIAIPFNGLNAALKKIKSIDILGLKPFNWISPIKVPQITPLATGTVVPPNREFLALLGDNKKEPEVVSPISTMKQAVLEAISESGITSGGGNDYGDIVVMIDGREVFRAVRKQSVEYKKQTGKPAFS